MTIEYLKRGKSASELWIENGWSASPARISRPSLVIAAMPNFRGSTLPSCGM